MTRLPSRLLVLWFALAATVCAVAQSVRWDPPGGTLGVGQTTQLSLIFEDCTPTGELSLPKVPNLSYGVPSQSRQTSMTNFSTSSRVVFTYGVLPIQRGPLEIPSFTVETDHGIFNVPAAHFEVGEATVGQAQISIKSVAESQLTVGPASVWAGEVFDLHYRLLISRRFNPVGVGTLEWQPPANLVVEPWGKLETINMNNGNDVRVGVTASTRALAPEPGLLSMPTAKQIIELQTGGSQGFGFFAAPNTEKYQIESVAPTFAVKPLPANPPEGFLRAVGQFQFSSRVVPASTTVGEPITWTLKLEGVGNWPAGLSLPSREAPKNFQVLRPQTQRTMKENSLFEGAVTEDVVLVPTQPGTYRLGAVTYTYFDTKAGRYQTVRTDPVQIEVKPPAPPLLPQATNGAPVIQFSAQPPANKAAAPTLPNRLPLEPLLGTASGWRPAERVAPWLLFLPLVPVVAVGVLLGQRRARLTDPRRPQRAALLELRDAFRTAAAANDRDAQLALVATWQRLAPQIWAAGSATPSPEMLSAAIAREQPSADAAAWVALWREADAFRFGRDAGPLPDNWRVRAASLLQAVRLPELAWHAALRPSNVLPLLVGLLLVGALVSAPRAVAATATTSGSDDPRANYTRGEFAAAEKSWRAATVTEPGDWKSRHNLGLALAQQDKWSEAAAQWSAAFLVAPREESVRWNLDIGLTKAEFTQPQLIAFATGSGASRFARVASPAEWQVAAISGAVAIGLGFALWLLALHRPRRTAWLATGITLAAAGVLTIVASYSALRVYGVLAKPDAVLVWKATELRTIPTEAGQQKNEPLAAGTIARVTRTFLGWQQLTLANGQTGWVRKDNLVFFYR